MPVKAGITTATPVINITIPQKANFEEVFTYTNDSNAAYDLTGYGVTAALRKHVGAAASVGFSYVGIASSAAGQVKVSMSSSVTGIITEGRYDYDVRLTTADGLTEVRLVEGMAIVTAGVS